MSRRATDAPWLSAEPGLREKALRVHGLLCAAYGCPIAYFHALDPLSELVSSLLSHRTRNSDSGRAFRSLRRRFPSWDLVRDAPVSEIEATIAAATWPEQKAPRIKKALELVSAWRDGDLDLAFLGGMPEAEARAWLERIPGVGPKTSAAVLSFSSLRRAALPVDSHHHRVASRLGLLPRGVPVGKSHAMLRALLPEDWDAQSLYDNHEVMMIHGQRCCYFQRPECHRCAILSECPTGRGMLAPARAVTSRVAPDPGAGARSAD